jgi:hypothetical protein
MASGWKDTGGGLMPPGAALEGGQAKNPYLIPDDPKGMLTSIMRRYKLGAKSRPEFRPKLNLMFLLGEHWMTWDPYSRRLRQNFDNPYRRESRPRITINKVGSHVERAVARLTKSSPTPECRPVTDEEDDVGAAKVGTRILVSEANRIQIDTRITALYFWVVPVGWAYLQCTWNPELGQVQGTVTEEALLKVPDPTDRMAVRMLGNRGPQMRKALVSKDVHQGDVVVDVVPHFELVVDPSATSMDGARWAIRSVTLTKEEVWERYGRLPATTEQAPGISLIHELRSFLERTAARQPEVHEEVVVHQFWMPPGSRSRPEGLVVTYSGLTILEDPKPYPYDHGKLPFVQFNLMPGIFRREGRTWVDDLISMQADYNDARCREAEIRNDLVPKLLYPKGSIDDRKLNTRVQAIGYSQIGQPPHWEMPNAGWAQVFEETMNRVDKEMGERAAVSPATRGEVLSGLSAAALLAAQEAADVPGNISVKELSDGIATLGWQHLMLIRQFWTEKRLVRTWSEEADRMDVEKFRGADLPRQLDVHVTPESALPRSKAARVQIALELQKAGLVRDPATILRYIDLPGTDLLIREIDEDTREAMWENDQMLQGNLIQIQKWQNMVVHSYVHNRLRKSDDFRKAGPHIQAIIDAHCDLHDALMQGQLGAIGPVGAPGSVQPGSAGSQGGAQPGDLMGRIAQMAGIQGGKAGQPGPIPGVSPDTQAASMGH